ALVGTGGMMPLPTRWLSSVLVRYGPHLVLFDCGEGTQISLQSLGWGIKNIDLLLISHVHGDHVTGLPGLLLTQGNSGRTEPLQIVGPAGLRQVVSGLLSVARYLPFAVECRELTAADGERVGLEELSVTWVEAEHHVECLAYRLDLPRGPRFPPEHARKAGVGAAGATAGAHPLQHGAGRAGGVPGQCRGGFPRDDRRPRSPHAELALSRGVSARPLSAPSPQPSPRGRGSLLRRECRPLGEGGG